MYSSSYWTGSADSQGADYVFYVKLDGLFYSDHYGNLIGGGVRPVFDISVSDL